MHPLSSQKGAPCASVVVEVSELRALVWDGLTLLFVCENWGNSDDGVDSRAFFTTMRVNGNVKACMKKRE